MVEQDKGQNVLLGVMCACALVWGTQLRRYSVGKAPWLFPTQDLSTRQANWLARARGKAGNLGETTGTLPGTTQIYTRLQRGQTGWKWILVGGEVGLEGSSRDAAAKLARLTSTTRITHRDARHDMAGPHENPAPPLARFLHLRSVAGIPGPWRLARSIPAPRPEGQVILPSQIAVSEVRALRCSGTSARQSRRNRQISATQSRRFHQNEIGKIDASPWCWGMRMEGIVPSSPSKTDQSYGARKKRGLPHGVDPQSRQLPTTAPGAGRRDIIYQCVPYRITAYIY